MGGGVRAILIIFFVEDEGSCRRFFISVDFGRGYVVGRPLLGLGVRPIILLKEVDVLVESCTGFCVGYFRIISEGSFCAFPGVVSSFFDNRGDLRGSVTLLHIACILFGRQTDV